MRTDDTQYLALIPRAQERDPVALTELLSYIDQRYGWMIAKLYSSDPMLSREDIYAEFLEGVVGGIPIVSMDIGNPLFHLAQRGLWNAKSAVESAKKYQYLPRRLKEVDASDDEAWNDGEFMPTDRTESSTEDIVVQRHFARHVTHVLSMADLTGNERKAFLLILSGELGDPCEMGWNKKLANALSVSPQRASQITAKLHYIYGHEEAGVAWV